MLFLNDQIYSRRRLWLGSEKLGLMVVCRTRICFSLLVGGIWMSELWIIRMKIHERIKLLSPPLVSSFTKYYNQNPLFYFLSLISSCQLYSLPVKRGRGILYFLVGCLYNLSSDGAWQTKSLMATIKWNFSRGWAVGQFQFLISGNIQVQGFASFIS